MHFSFNLDFQFNIDFDPVMILMLPNIPGVKFMCGKHDIGHCLSITPFIERILFGHGHGLASKLNFMSTTFLIQF